MKSILFDFNAIAVNIDACILAENVFFACFGVIKDYRQIITNYGDKNVVVLSTPGLPAYLLSTESSFIFKTLRCFCCWNSSVVVI